MKMALAKCLLLITLVSNAQVTHHFPHENASWGQFRGTGWVFSAGFSGSTHFFNALGYVWVDSVQYIAIGGLQSQNTLLREDTTGKVWYLHPWTQTELLVYDFGAEVGDTVVVWNGWEDWGISEFYEVVVDSVDSVLLNNGEARRRLHVNVEGLAGATYWIEGMGSNQGLPYPAYPDIIDWTSWMTCFTENDTVKWGEICDLVLGTKEVSNDEISIYPNPNTGNFVINYSHQGVDNLELTITNALGQTVHTQQLNTTKSSEQIELTNATTGVYVLSLRSGNDVYNTKLVIQR